MRFLKIKKYCKPRADGSVIYYPLIVDSPRKFAPQKDRRETGIRKTRCQLIYGAHDSGKSRWLQRMHQKWSGIWGSQTKAEPLFLGALHPVSSWTDQPAVGRWHDDQETEKARGDENYSPRPWAKINQHQKAWRLADYVLETGAIVFLDDAHKLTGRKLEIARRCILSAKIWLITCSQENRLPPNMRPIVERREPQRTRLLTDVAYDATAVVMWLIVAAALAIGWWEIALVLGGLRALSSGRRAARPD